MRDYNIEKQNTNWIRKKSLWLNVPVQCYLPTNCILRYVSSLVFSPQTMLRANLSYFIHHRKYLGEIQVFIRNM